MTENLEDKTEQGNIEREINRDFLENSCKKVGNHTALVLAGAAAVGAAIGGGVIGCISKKYGFDASLVCEKVMIIGAAVGSMEIGFYLAAVDGLRSYSQRYFDSQRNDESDQGDK